jgi:biotin-(acetyl-CoA carboxylase) ligase
LAFARARHLGNGYERLLDRGGFDRSAWIDYTNSLGRSVRVCEVGGESVEGRTIDVTPSGALVVETSTGQRHTVIAGDVNFV